MNVASTAPFFLAAVAEDDATIVFSMSEEHDRVVTVSVLKSELKILKSELTSELTSELKSELKSALTDFEKRVEKRISEEGKTTRRHVNIMVEKVNDSVRLVAEVFAHHSTVLDDHETRLQKIEKQA